MNLWLIIISIGILTYAIRLSFISLLRNVTLPVLLLRAFRFVPIAVLSAIIAPQLFLRGTVFDISLDNPRWIAGLIAIGIAWYTKNVLLTIVSGMILLWILQLLVH